MSKRLLRFCSGFQRLPKQSIRLQRMRFGIWKQDVEGETEIAPWVIEMRKNINEKNQALKKKVDRAAEAAAAAGGEELILASTTGLEETILDEHREEILEPKSAILEKASHTILTYYYTPEHKEKRKPYRAAHKARFEQAKEAGMLVLGGPTLPPDMAFYVFKDVSKDYLDDFIKNDPYVIHGLVQRHTISPWNAAIQ